MASQERRFDAGEALCEDGEPAEHLFIVTRGEVDIQYRLNNGESRTVDTLVTGDLVVWSAVLEPYRATARSVARGRVETVAIAAGELRQCCGTDRELGFAMMKAIAEVVRQRLHAARVMLATQG